MKVYSMIDSPNEYEPGLLITFCATLVKKLKLLQRMYELISAFATQRFCSFWKKIPPEYYTQRAKNFTLY